MNPRRIALVFLALAAALFFAREIHAQAYSAAPYNVQAALAAKGGLVRKTLGRHGVSAQKMRLLIVAFKAESTLELYGKASDARQYQKIAAYPICAASGTLGPKRRQGDRQVPEGFYEIDRFNPQSRYLLSLGINYPNAADRLTSAHPDLGSDIFIHGDCVSIGCLAMTNDKIQEIYLYALFARESGQKNIPVYIFPFRMTEARFRRAEQKYRDRPDLLRFWKNLQAGFLKFERSRTALSVSMDAQGVYHFR